MMCHLQSVAPPAVGLRAKDEIDGGLAEKIQNAGVVKADGQKQIEGSEGGEEDRTGVDEQHHAQYRQQAADRQISQPPQTKGGGGFEVVRVDIDSQSPPKQKQPRLVQGCL